MTENNETVRLGDIAEIKVIPLSDLRAEDLVVTNEFWKCVRSFDVSGEAGFCFVTVFDAVEHPDYVVPKFDKNRTPLTPQKIKCSFQLNGQLRHLSPLKGAFSKLDDFLESKRLILRIKDEFLPGYVKLELQRAILSTDWSHITPAAVHMGWNVSEDDSAFQVIKSILLQSPIAQLNKDSQAKALAADYLKRSSRVSWEDSSLNDRLRDNHAKTPDWNSCLDLLREPIVDVIRLKDVMRQFNHSLGDLYSGLPDRVEHLATQMIRISLEDEEFEAFEKEQSKEHTFGPDLTDDRIQKARETRYFELLDSYDVLKDFLYDQCPYSRDAFGLSLHSRVSFFDLSVISRIYRSLPEKTYVIDRAKASIRDSYTKRLEAQKEQAAADARAAEKERIMGVLCHNIHGLLTGSVVRPAQDLEDEGVNVSAILEGTGLLQDIVESIKLSKSRSGDFVSDVKFATEADRSFRSIILRSLFSTISNMLSEQFSGNSCYEYFSSREQLVKAKSAVKKIKPDDERGMVEFALNHFLIDVRIDLDKDVEAKFRIRNEFKSASRMTVLMQEIFQNAFKHLAFVKNGRQLSLRLLKKGESDVAVRVTNSKITGSNIDTGLGEEIIVDFFKQFGTTQIIRGPVGNEYVVEFCLPKVFR